MQQTGILKIKGTNQDGLVIEPITLSSIFFSQDGVLKVTTRTDEAGRFDFDLPFGKYRVEVNSGTGALLPLSLGNLFELKEGDAVDTFEKWAEIPATDNDFEDRVLKPFKELADSAAKSATDAQLSANSAYDTVTEVVKNKGEELDQKEADALANLQSLIESGQVLISQQVVDGNNALVITINNGRDELNQIAQNAKSSETNAKASELEAKRQVDSIQTKLDEKQDILEFVGGGQKVMKDGAFGLGGISILDGYIGRANQFWRSEAVQGSEFMNYGYGLTFRTAAGAAYADFWFTHTNSSQVKFRSLDALGNYTQGEFKTTVNTTIDTNGFIKNASPIIKLFNDRIETNGQFDEEPIFEKIGTGTYKISNTLGLAQEGWTFEKPRGGDGNPYFRIVVTKLEDGCIISVHDEYEAIEQDEIIDVEGNNRTINRVVKILSQARDIKEHERWIDLRFHEEEKEIDVIIESMKE